jgi:hypothetical protein
MVTILAWNDQLCHEILEAERRGQPAMDLRDFPDIAPEQRVKRIQGIDLQLNHPTILFGDGGSAKSYLGLWIAGLLAQEGLRIALFDWELSGEDHKVRLKRLFGAAWPQIMYARCDRPLVNELDRLRRIVREHHTDFAVYDSIGMACGGAPESAEVAGAYFRAVRRIGVGSKHITHVSKAENADQYPFGSIYWHNLARSTWYVKATDETPDQTTLDIGLFNRKANLGAKTRAPLAFRITFSEDSTTFKSIQAAAVPKLAEKMSIRQRMAHALKAGAMTSEVLAQEIGAEVGSIDREARRHRDQFTILQGGKLGLKAV